MSGEEFEPPPEEIRLPQESASPKEDPPKSWGELRETIKSTPYSEQFSGFMDKSQEWVSKPRTGVSREDWNSEIDTQLTKATNIVSEFQNPDTTLEEHGTKIWAYGKEIPPFGEDVLTRLYLGVDPRHATDAYRALLDELGKSGVLKDVNVALNLEELREKKLAGNQIIIYEPQSRPEVLNSVLDAYRQAKLSNPGLFRLSDRQREKIMRVNLKQFKAVIDDNASFVEMAPEDRGRSYDADIVNQTRTAFSLDISSMGDQEWLDTVRKGEVNGVVWTRADREKINKGLVYSGVVLNYKRRLSSPALIQTGVVTAK